jgi:hypothetical protein
MVHIFDRLPGPQQLHVGAQDVAGDALAPVWQFEGLDRRRTSFQALFQPVAGLGKFTAPVDDLIPRLVDSIEQIPSGSRPSGPHQQGGPAQAESVTQLATRAAQEATLKGDGTVDDTIFPALPAVPQVESPKGDPETGLVLLQALDQCLEGG